MAPDLAGLASLGWSRFFAQQLTALTIGDLLPARVAAIQRTHLELLHAHGVSQGTLGGRWYQYASEARPTVGDWVLVDPNSGAVELLLERSSLLKRMTPGGDGVQLIAANVDVLFLVSSCNADFNTRRLERYLALALEAGVTPVVVLTKVDLAEDPHAYLAQAQALRPGLVVEAVNALQRDTLEPLRAWCDVGQTVALLGSSGVGKSTLLNTLAGADTQRTAAVREHDAKGRHTTTHRSLHLLPDGGLVLDSPGIRELGMADVERGVNATFADVEALAADCRFADCGHAGEPGCAVQAAIDEGHLAADRVASYFKLKREEAYNRETIAERHARSRAFGRLTRGAQSRKRPKPD